MSSSGSLMRLRQGNEGEFLNWLEKLGLKDFLHHYPVRRLVEWGWLSPQSRVIFPESFFLEEDEPPSFESRRRSDLKGEQLLWDSSWFVGESEPLWFLDPFFRPGDKEGQVLFGKDSAGALPAVPEPFMHPDGVEVIPFVDYFFHWQGYALIDVIRTADTFGPILHTPDLKERLAFIEEVRSERLAEWNPEEILTLPTRWGGLSEPMTWLSHYRDLRDAIPLHNADSNLLRKGALELAAYLGVTEEKLAYAVKDQLLVLAQDWRRANDRYYELTQRAYPYLQADIQIAMEWLYFLTGNELDFYLDKWQYDTMGQRQWAELHAVLEYEFFTERKFFIKTAPKYLNDYCKQFVDESGLNGNNLGILVDAIRSTNYPFDSFLGAFRQMHEEMTYRFEHKGGLDFRERRPLVYYSVLAIRAEGCLRFALEKGGMLDSIENQGLSKYIECLAQRRGLSSKAIERFRGNLNKTNLHEAKEYPIASIMKLNLGLSEKENYLVQAFLSCVVARNYFAHHYCFDKEVRKSKESGFMLTGILVTVLYLLDER
ncbi:MAG: hypothetical protein EPO42_12520 [Gallionellaceae bacterium]|nr:MAG: hypothetical protein EPO42_12520 [Gallionellaceae bacterium]